jgi:hypothetical protein
LSKIYRFPIDSITKANGNCPSEEFYKGLDKKVKAKFIAIFDGIENSADGTLHDKNKLEKLHGKHTHDLWEMKVWFKGVWYRLLCYRDGRAWKLTHGFTKNTNRTPPNEIKKGVEILKEYLKTKGVKHD